MVGERTVTQVHELKQTERVDELAQMLGTETATTRQNAEELLKETTSVKAKVKSQK